MSARSSTAPTACRMANAPARWALPSPSCNAASPRRRRPSSSLSAAGASAWNRAFANWNCSSVAAKSHHKTSTLVLRLMRRTSTTSTTRRTTKWKTRRRRCSTKPPQPAPFWNSAPRSKSSAGSKLSPSRSGAAAKIANGRNCPTSSRRSSRLRPWRIDSPRMLRFMEPNPAKSHRARNSCSSPSIATP